MIGSVDVVGGVIGAKLSMLVFLGPVEFWRQLPTIPSHGAVLTERVLKVGQCTEDLVAPFIPLGQAIGRLGNFLADAWSTPTSLA